jgi:ankyrin repeat protein
MMPNGFNSRNENPVWCAAYYGVLDSILLKKLVESGYDLDEPDAVNGYTPLMIASIMKHQVDALCLLYYPDPFPSPESQYSNSLDTQDASFLALNSKKNGIVVSPSYVDISCKSFSRDTVLHLACLHGCQLVVDGLCQFRSIKSLWNQKNALGRTPCDYAVEGKHVEILNVIKEHESNSLNS